MAANDRELIHAQSRYVIEKDVTDYVRREVNCPWLTLTVNQFTDMIEVWFDQPGRSRYLVTQKPFMGDMNLGGLIRHLREIDGSNEPLTKRVARQEKEHEAIHEAQKAAYLDKVMPAAERLYYEVWKDSTGHKGMLF